MAHKSRRKPRRRAKLSCWSLRMSRLHLNSSTSGFILETGSRLFHQSVIVKSVLVWMKKQSCGEKGPAGMSWSPPLSWMCSQILHGSAASRSQVPNHKITLPPHTFKVKARHRSSFSPHVVSVLNTLRSVERWTNGAGNPKNSGSTPSPERGNPEAELSKGSSGKHSSVAAADVIICQRGWSNFWTHFQLGVTFRNDYLVLGFHVTAAFHQRAHLQQNPAGDAVGAHRLAPLGCSDGIFGGVWSCWWFSCSWFSITFWGSAWGSSKDQ